MGDSVDVEEYERRILKLEVENEAIAGLKEGAGEGSKESPQAENPRERIGG